MYKFLFVFIRFSHVFICFYRFSTEELRLATGASAPVARRQKEKRSKIYETYSNVVKYMMI